MLKLDRFDDILIDLDDVRCLIGTVVIFKDGTKQDIGRKAADAMRGIFTPVEERITAQPADAAKCKCLEAVFTKNGLIIR